MERHLEYEMERFSWLIVLVLSFAAMAQQAAGAPEAVRCRALPHLGRAAFYVRFLVFRWSGPARHEPASYPDSREEAWRLAASFRAAALALMAIADHFTRRCQVEMLRRARCPIEAESRCVPGFAHCPAASNNACGPVNITGPP